MYLVFSRCLFCYVVSCLWPQETLASWLMIFPRSCYSQSSSLMKLLERMDEPFTGNLRQEDVSTVVTSHWSAKAVLISSYMKFSSQEAPCLSQSLEVSRARSSFIRYQYMMILSATRLAQWARIEGWPLPRLLIGSKIQLLCHAAMPFGSGKPHCLRTWFSGLLACVQGYSFPENGTEQF